MRYFMFSDAGITPLNVRDGAVPLRIRRALRPIAAVVYRLATVALQLLVVSIVVFGILRILPADPLAMMLPPNATNEDAERMREAFGLNRSIPEQYLIWLGHALQGDLGTSIQSRLPVGQLILTALPMTLELVVCGLLLGVFAGFCLGLITFSWRGRAVEKAAEVIASLAQSIPEFLWGILLILIFGLALHLLPFIGPIDAKMLVPSRTGFLLIDTLLAGRWTRFSAA